MSSWAKGQSAPYDLFEADGVLVEAVGDDRVPVVSAGETVDADLAARVETQVNPPTVAATAQLIDRDEHNQVVVSDGQVRTTEVTVQVPERPPKRLSEIAALEPPDGRTCDMCGRTDADTTRVGDGNYCDHPRLAPGMTEPRPCLDIRVDQMEDA